MPRIMASRPPPLNLEVDTFKNLAIEGVLHFLYLKGKGPPAQLAMAVLHTVIFSSGIPMTWFYKEEKEPLKQVIQPQFRPPPCYFWPPPAVLLVRRTITNLSPPGLTSPLHPVFPLPGQLE